MFDLLATGFYCGSDQKQRIQAPCKYSLWRKAAVPSYMPQVGGVNISHWSYQLVKHFYC